MKLDSVDIKILEFLQNDGKVTAKEMAAKLNLTPTPIYERIKKMESAGLIRGYTVLLDKDMLGLSFTVFINISIKEHSKEARQQFVDDITGLTEVVELYHTSGIHDFLAKVRFANVKEYKEFLIDKLSVVENIGDLDSQIVLEEVKYSPNVNF